MTMGHLYTAVALIAMCLSDSSTINGAASTGIQLPTAPTYLVLAPRKIRSEQELRVSVTVFRMLYTSFTFRVSVRHVLAAEKKELEIALVEEIFYRPASRIIRLKVPENIPQGNYSIHVEGSVQPLGGLIFHNRTELIFEPKLFSTFIQFSKPVYAMGDMIRFRVIPYEFNLMVKNRVFTSIELVDSNGVSVRRWLSPRSNARGFIELSLQLPDTCNHGEWKVRCHRETFVTEKSFTVSFNTMRTMISVNVTMPQRLSEFAFGVYGILEANHTTNVASQGNATIRLEFHTRGSPSVLLGVMWKEIPYFHGRSEFLFTMQEIQTTLKLPSRQAQTDLDVRADAWVFDWQYLVTENSSANTVIFREVANLRFIGGQVRQFKPGFPFTALIWIFQPDGQKPDFRYRHISIDVYCDTSKHVKTDQLIPIPDDSVLRYTLQTTTDCINYRLVAVLQSSTNAQAKTAEQFIFRHYSATGTYLRVSTSTERPTVDRYMVFNVRSTYYAPQIHYLILAGGNILHSDILNMPAGVLSKTFSLALSREMAPVARIVTYFMKQDGELVTDSLSFFVELLSMSSIGVTISQGSDLTGKTVTGWVSGATPGSFALLSAVPYDLYLRYGARVLLEPNTLLEEQMYFESHAEQPLRYRWFDEASDVPNARYFPAPTLGPDANKTMNFSGLIMFTDSNYSRVSFWHTCNETRGSDREFPCYSNSPDQCYGRRHRCNGYVDCVTGVDEADCESEDIRSIPGYVEARLQLLYRHFIYDGNWLWQDVYMKPFSNGQTPIYLAEVPKLETAWVIGAIAIHPSQGIQVQSVPARFTSTRRFYMVLDAPQLAYWGEQIGVRVALFNRWDYWTEVIVEMMRNPDCDFVSVGPNGQVNSYAPELKSNVSVHTMVYLRAGDHKTVYFPVLPRNIGTSVVTFCAYSFIGGECSTVTISVSINGISNSYSTPILLDLVDNSELLAQNFYIIPEQSFVEPEKRWRRFVPGSKGAVLTVVGDIVGPTLGPNEPFCDAACAAWKPVGSAESVLFNINRNVQMLHYLRMTKQLQTSTLNTALDYVNTQYARLSFYIDPLSGGVSNFPERFTSETSTFLTAFGLFTLAETAFSEWDRITYIGVDIFQKFLLFLNSSQVRTGDPNLIGSFNDDTKWDIKHMYPYMSEKLTLDDNRMYLERTPITALAVMAAKHPNIPKPLSSLASVIGNSAIGYLRRHLRKMGRCALCLGMTAYALTFDETAQAKFDARDMLLSTVRTDNYLYWSNSILRPLIREPDSAGKMVIKPRIEWPNDGTAVQATAFALLALFKTGSQQTDPVLRSNITKIINFLTETKNMPNGWVSTQDTVFAVKALREIAELDFNRMIYQMQVEIVPTADVSKAATYVLDGSNLTVPRVFTLDNDDTWGEVMVKATGSGRAVLQLYTKKSVENSFQVKNAADPIHPQGSLQTFELTCDATYTGRNGSTVTMTTCARWAWVAESETSGMAILSYSVPTGHRITNYDLRNFVQASGVRGLRHIWESGNTINMFFTNFTSTEKTCVTLSFHRWHPVANITVEQYCQVYDFFENDNGNFSFYSARSLHSADVCKVCGSFQCPYCPGYNAVAMALPVAQLLVASLFVAVGWNYCS